MNNVRRKTLASIIEKIGELHDLLEEVQAEEEEYRDNIPENLQSSERYEKADAAVDNLYDAVSRLEEAISSIEEAIE